jgi:hypothetical protein
MTQRYQASWFFTFIISSKGSGETVDSFFSRNLRALHVHTSHIHMYVHVIGIYVPMYMFPSGVGMWETTDIDRYCK